MLKLIGALLISILLFGNVDHMSCKVHYIIPSNGHPCDADSCLTLSQFAYNSTSLIDSNTTLLITGGNHYLDKEIAVSNVERFTMLSTNGTSITSINCNTCSNLTFTNIGHVQIYDLTIIGCGNSSFSMVNQLTIQQSRFLNSTGTSIRIINGTNANITGTFFSSNIIGTCKKNLTYLQMTSTTAYKISSCTVRVGGAVIMSNSTITMDNCTFEDNSANIGGAIFCELGSNVSVSNSEFNSNHATGCTNGICAGGVFFIDSTCTVLVHNSDFNNNTSDQDGGMVTVFNAYLLISQSSANSNTAERYGGAIHITKSSLWLDNSDFTYNFAETGGGAISTYESNTTIINTNFVNNSVHADGGVAYIKNKSIIAVSNCWFVKNSATSNGGVLYIEMESSLAAINDSIIYSSLGTCGEYTNANHNVNVSVNNSQFINNEAGQRGGVMYLSKNSSAVIIDSMFSQNRVDFAGGVISVREVGSSAFICTCTFSNNMATIFSGVTEVTNGGGIFVSGSVFDNNYSGDQGGVVDCYNSSTFGVYESNFTNNTARVGGVASISEGCKLFAIKCNFQNNHGIDFGAVIHAFKGTNTTIQDCNFSHNSALFGGVLTMESDNNVTVNNSVLNNNTAELDGGAIYLRTWCRFIISNSLINDNNASNNGIILANDNSFVMIERTTFSDNVAGHDGGSLYVNDNSTIIVRQSNLTGNYAGNSGGAVYGLRNSSISVSACTFEHNAAQNSGGGIHVQKNTTVTIDTSNFTINKADYGGVLRIYIYSTANITSSIIAQNSADVAGGAMAVYAQSRLFIYGSNISNNVGNSGGVAYAIQNNFEDNNYSPYIETNLIEIIECDFWNNTGNYGILDIEGTSLIIQSTLFQQNNAKYIGGVIYAKSLSIIDISATNFTGNIAEDDGGVMFLIGDSIASVNTSVFTRNIASNRGGAIHLSQSNASILNSMFSSSIAGQSGGVIHAILDSSVSIDNSSFINNTAKKHGGVVSSSLSSHLMGQYCIFINNSASGSGGALQISESSSVAIADCIFQLNQAQDEGGAILASSSSQVTIAGSSLSQNRAEKGAALALEDNSCILFYFSPLINSNERQTVTSEGILIHSNNATTSGGGIYMQNSHLYLRMETNISFNQGSQMGGGILALNSSISIGCTIHFDSNQATSGGGVSLVNSRLSKLNDDESMIFDVNFVSNNAKSFGGAIYVEDEQNNATCYNDLDPYPIDGDCFFQNVTKSLMFNFTYNHANSSGHDLFGGLLDRCTVVSGIINVSKIESNGVTSFVNISNINHNLDTVSSKPVRVCHCINNQPSCSHKVPSIKVKNGNDFNISVAAVDQVYHPITATISSSFKGLSLLDSQTIHKVGASCSDLNYRAVSFPQAPREYQLILYADGPCRDAGISKLIINVHVDSCVCPLGFMRSNASSACVCECDNQDKIFAMYIQECNALTKSVIRKGRFWITYLNDSDNSSSPYFIYPYCPLDYCQPLTIPIPVNLNLSNGSDAQCANCRSGILCGKCKPNFSLSLGSSSCTKCHKNWYGLFAGIMIVALFTGIVLVVVILMLNITVAVGSLNSIIFYANIIYANRSIYFSHSHMTPVKVFISWLNLEIGIDTCFYEGMDMYAKTWIELAFPTYMIFLVIVIILVSSRSTKLSNLLGKRNPVATLATLILLSYTKVLETVIASLSFVSWTYPNGTVATKWLPDANIDYAKGKHIALLCVAILILIMGLLYTIIIFSWQWLHKWQRSVFLKWTRNLKFHYFVSTYHTPHTTKHRYWTGMLLLVRVIVYLISAFSVSVDPRISLLSITVIISCLLVYKAMFMIRVYKNWILNMLESYVYFNIVIFTNFSWYTFDDTNKQTFQTISAYISVGTMFILSLMVIIYHVYRFSSTKLYSFGQKSKLGRKIKALNSGHRAADYEASLHDSLMDAIDTSRVKYNKIGDKSSLPSDSGPTSSVVSLTDCAGSPTLAQPQDEDAADSDDKTSILHDDKNEQIKTVRSLSGINTRKSKPKLLPFSSLRVSNKGITEVLLDENEL